jgi:signal transduction histidine kinase
MVGDEKRALQVLLNLVNNAIKFTEKGQVKISAAVERDLLRVAVADTGIGIRAEHIGMLFEAFRQLDGSAKRIYEGTGLRLYLCRKLLKLMGGDIQVESVYGVGSCFTYTMPLELRVEATQTR